MYSDEFEVRRRIDRAARRLRSFHGLAHYPLCAAYTDEALKIGRYFICKGCTYAGLGCLIGIGLVLTIPVSRQAASAGIAVCSVFAGILQFILRKRPPSKVLTRLVPGFNIAGTLTQVAVARPVLTPLLLLVSFFALQWFRRRKRTRKTWKKRCDDCCERHMSPCAGYRRQVYAERALRRLSERWRRSLPEVPVAGLVPHSKPLEM